MLLASTNNDRILALYHAAKNAKRYFVCDEYQANILKKVSENHKQYTDFYNIDYDLEKKDAGCFVELKQFNSILEKSKNYLDKYGFCMIIRENPNLTPILDKYAKSNETKIYYSMWKGYLDRNKDAFKESLFNFLEPYEIEYMHTSGHADLETLKKVFEAVKPKGGIIPIHTEAPEKFQELFHEQFNIILLQDGAVFDAR